MDEDSEYGNDPELEAEFKKAVNDASVKINEKLNAAYKLVNEAVDISEEYGIPFSSYVSLLSNNYTPQSFEKQFGELNFDWVQEETGCWTDDPGDYGWQHSAIC